MNKRLRNLQDTPSWEWPDDTDAFLHGILCDPKAGAQDRLVAAELAGEFVVINDQLAGDLLAIVLDSAETDGLRSKAVISLGPALEFADTEGFDDPEAMAISEEVFRRIRKSLRELFMDPDAPDEVRRRTLEASVRAPQTWHREAIRAAHTGDDRRWKLTSVFCMRYIRGFEEQILEAFNSPDEEILFEAVCGAGEWEIQAAWPHLVRILTDESTDKALLLAAIEAAGSISPQEAPDVVGHLAESDDEDIAEAALDVLEMSDSSFGLEDDDDIDR